MIDWEVLGPAFMMGIVVALWLVIWFSKPDNIWLGRPDQQRWASRISLVLIALATAWWMGTWFPILIVLILLGGFWILRVALKRPSQ
jgi:hypothetical protein